MTGLGVGSSFAFELERVRNAAVRGIARAEGKDTSALDSIVALQAERELESTRDVEYLLGLRPDEVSFLWAVVAATVDPELALHLPRLGPRYGRTGISVAQFAGIHDLDRARGVRLARDLLSTSPLVQHRVIEPIDPQTISTETAWVAAPRIVTFLAGEDVMDPTVADVGGRMIEPPTGPILDSDADEIRTRIRAHLSGPPCVLVLQGKRGTGRRTLARIAAEQPVIAIDLAWFDVGNGTRLRDALTALGREALLSGAVPLISGAEELVTREAAALRREVTRYIESTVKPVFLVTTTSVPHLDLSKPLFRFEVPLPGPPTRAKLWQRELGAAADRIQESVTRAALRFELGPGGIHDAAVAAYASAAARDTAICELDLFAGVRSTVEERLQGLARRHPTHLSWDDVVLPIDVRLQVELLLSRVRNAYEVLETWGFKRHLPGTGVAALFSGPPGTGKTMLASVIASTLGLELFRVDLAQITSKWIGETEKQLDRVFDAADTGHAMLLFDEADSLFAKRTEVKGATERYANLEVNFLLQRIETFSGVAILTTNMDGSLDPAFRRRLAAHIRFPHPDVEERRELWGRLMPRTAPVAARLDLDELAREFPAFAGAQIRNALTTAAFLAVSGGGVIDQELLRRAAAEEAQAMGRVVAARRE
jgi:AAA+ superfamily predicted ATPase